MRRILAVAFIPALLAACGPSEYKAQVADFKNQLALHFNRMNQEGAIAAMEAKAAPFKKTEEATTTGRVTSTYQWIDTGVVLRNVEAKAARTRIPLLVYSGAELNLPGAAPGMEKPADATTVLAADLTEADLKKYDASAAPMFAIVSGEQRPIIAIVRYVRRQRVLDPQGTVQISAKGYEKAQTTPEELGPKLAADPKNYYGGGYHRPDATFVVTTAFVYRGGGIEQVDPASVTKLLAGEKVPASQMKLGATVGLETEVATWAQPAKPSSGGTH